MKKILYFLLGLVILVLIAFFVILNLPKASSENKKADLSIESTALFADYSNNEKKANQTYNGKVIEVSGKLVNISSDEQGATVLILDSGDDFGGVLCTLEKKPKVLPEVGEEIKVKGQCNGMLMDVVLNKCVLVKS